MFLNTDVISYRLDYIIQIELYQIRHMFRVTFLSYFWTRLGINFGST